MRATRTYRALLPCVDVMRADTTHVRGCGGTERVAQHGGVHHIDRGACAATAVQETRVAKKCGHLRCVDRQHVARIAEDLSALGCVHVRQTGEALSVADCEANQKQYVGPAAHRRRALARRAAAVAQMPSQEVTRERLMAGNGVGVGVDPDDGNPQTGIDL